MEHQLSSPGLHTPLCISIEFIVYLQLTRPKYHWLSGQDSGLLILGISNKCNTAGLRIDHKFLIRIVYGQCFSSVVRSMNLRLPMAHASVPTLGQTVQVLNRSRGKQRIPMLYKADWESRVLSCSARTKTIFSLTFVFSLFLFTARVLAPRVRRDCTPSLQYSPCSLLYGLCL